MGVLRCQYTHAPSGDMIWSETRDAQQVLTIPWYRRWPFNTRELFLSMHFLTSYFGSFVRSGRNDHNHDRYQGEMMLETRVQPQFAGWPLIGRLFCPPPILFNPAPLFPWFVLRNCCKKGTYLIRFGRRTHRAHAHQFVVASHAAFLATTQIAELLHWLPP